MSGQLTPQMTVPSVAVRDRLENVRAVAAHPGFSSVRRAAIRMQAARVTRSMIRELVTVPPIAAPRTPLFVRLDALQRRYAQLGGDPADLVR